MKTFSIKARFFAAVVAPALSIPVSGVACDVTISIGTSSTSVIRDDQVNWSGCGTVGTTIQSALNSIGASGGGTLKLSGPGTLLVTQPLNIFRNTVFHGDTARTPYGMRIIGETTTSSCSTGGSYRHQHCPVLRVADQNTAGTNQNVTIWNIEIDGGSSSRPLSGSAIEITRSNNVKILHTKISGARRTGIAVADSRYVHIDYLSLVMVRKTGGEPEGGAGVWIKQSRDTILEHSDVSSPTYYASGVPSSDPRATASSAPTMDLVAVYGGSGNTVRHNTISYGNTAGVYLAACEDPGVCSPSGIQTARVSNATVWNNTIHHFRQHGLDVANTNSTSIVTNVVYFIGYDPLVLADSHNNTVRYNTLSLGNKHGGYMEGALTLGWGSSYNIISNNDIHADALPYAVYIDPPFAPPYASAAVNNTITSNKLWDGSMGYFGGQVANNVTSPNTLY